MLKIVTISRAGMGLRAVEAEETGNVLDTDAYRARPWRLGRWIELGQGYRPAGRRWLQGDGGAAGPGLIYLPEPGFAAAFAQNATAQDLAVLAAVQRPISLACITVLMQRPLWKDRPAWFLLAEQDRMIPQ